MLPRQRRLRTRRDYYRVFRGRRQVRGRLLIVQGVPNTAPAHRFGFIIGTVVDKKATVRNRLKRQLRHLVKSLPSTPPHWDVAIRPQRSAVGRTSAELSAELSYLYHQLLHASSYRPTYRPLPKNTVPRPRRVAA